MNTRRTCCLQTIPLIEALPGGMNSGSQLTITGSTHMNADRYCRTIVIIYYYIPFSSAVFTLTFRIRRFSINLQCGPNVSPRWDDVALHVSLDFVRRAVLRNSIQNMSWGPEESYGDMPLYPGQGFSLIITADPSQFTVNTFVVQYSRIRIESR
jgi:hypothetical protein